MSIEDNVTSGTVSFEDAVKVNTGGDPQYWPTRRAKVELTFDVFKNQDGSTVLNAISVAAKAKVREMLGEASAAAITAATAPATPPAAEPEKQTRTRRTQAQMAADAAAAEAAKNPPSPDTSSPSPGSADPNAEAGQSGSGAAGGTPTSADQAAQATPPASDEWDVGEPAPVSDADLNAACSATAERLKDPVAVRTTISKFAPADLPEGTKWKITELQGAAARTLFLEALKALQPAG